MKGPAENISFSNRGAWVNFRVRTERESRPPKCLMGRERSEKEARG
jgi:hypothetical protein